MYSVSVFWSNPSNDIACIISLYTDVVLVFFSFFSKHRRKEIQYFFFLPTSTTLCWWSINPPRFLFFITPFITRARRTLKRKWRVCEQAYVLYQASAVIFYVSSQRREIAWLLEYHDLILNKNALKSEKKEAINSTPETGFTRCKRSFTSYFTHRPVFFRIFPFYIVFDDF